MKKVLAIGLCTLSLTLSVRPVKANPALAVAPAVCATGVGCLLIGTVIIGGTVYYAWNHGGRRIVADLYGQLMQSGGQDNQGNQEIHTHWIYGNEGDCRKMAKKYNWQFITARKDSSGMIECKFSGSPDNFQDMWHDHQD